MPKSFSTFVAVGLTIGMILLAAGYILRGEEKQEDEENQPDEATVTQVYQVDDTGDIGPRHENLVEITSDHSPQQGSKVALGGELRWSGTIQWTGPENENMNTYGRSELGIHLILSKTSGTNELNVGLLLGDYSVEMGVPLPQGATGYWECISHDSKIIQELGGENVQSSASFDLSVTYQES